VFGADLSVPRTSRSPTLHPAPRFGAFFMHTQMKEHKRKISDSFVYVVRSGDYHKIGVASDISKRIKALQIGNPIKIKLTLIIKNSEMDAYLLEKCLHEVFEAKRVSGEWFVLTNDDIAFLGREYHSVHHELLSDDRPVSNVRPHELICHAQERIYNASMLIQYWNKINKIDAEFYTDGMMVSVMKMCMDYSTDQVVEAMETSFKQYVTTTSEIWESHAAFGKIGGILYNQFKY